MCDGTLVFRIRQCHSASGALGVLGLVVPLRQAPLRDCVHSPVQSRHDASIQRRQGSSVIRAINGCHLFLLQNSSYYWGFCAFVSYFINHPLYTPPAFGDVQVYVGLAGFIVSFVLRSLCVIVLLLQLAELGNFSIHLLFRNLRPAGSKERKIPVPDGNPFTLLFNFVSCPNYTYEVAAWLSFSIMTQSLPGTVIARLQNL